MMSIGYAGSAILQTRAARFSNRRRMTGRLGISFLLVTAWAGAQGHDREDRMQVPRLEQDVVVMADGSHLPLSRWLPDGKPCRVVLALHGFNDYRETFQTLAATLSDDCVAFYAYDQRGFGGTADRGLWPGRSRLVNDVMVVAGLLRHRYPETPLYLLGESMGGAVAMLALADDRPPPVDGAILLAPAVWARETQPWYQRAALWLGIRIMPGARLASKWIDVDPSDDPDVLEYWRSHPMVIRRTRVDALYGVANLMDAALSAAGRLQHPALILYGGEDEVIPPEAVCAMLRRLPDASAGWRFVYYPPGYHMLTRYSGEAVTMQDIRAWLKSPATVLPSGRERKPAQARNTLCKE